MHIDPGTPSGSEPWRNRMLLKLWVSLQSRVSSDRGAVASEYAILLSLIAVALVTAIGVLRGEIDAAIRAAAAAI